MTPLPKNKITRAERGKRRAGNKPSLKKDINNSNAPLAKNTFMGGMKSLIEKSKRACAPATQTQDLASQMSASRSEKKTAAKEKEAIKPQIEKNLSKQAPINKKTAPKVSVHKKASTSK